jgi:hypothetical protein
MKSQHIYSILIIGLILFFPLTSSAFGIQPSSIKSQIYDHTQTIISQVKENNLNNDDTVFFDIYDIEFIDNAYHDPNGLYSYEWWYFDATLENGYSAQISIRCLSVLYRTIFFIGLNLYNDGITLVNNQKIYINEEITVSLVEPLIKVDGKEIFKGYIDEETQDWIFLLNLEMDGIEIDFEFVGETQGWKGLVPGIGWWGVVLPKALVTGTLTIYGVELDVTGTGYHDHNWHITAIAGMNYGWYWGKINSESYSITWADVKMTRFTKTPFLTINKKDDSYINVPFEYVQIMQSDIRFDKGKLIPESFDIRVNYENISLHVHMKVFDTHHFRRLGFINYWRYHIRCEGYISIDGVIETIDEYNMAELLRLR